MEAQPETSILLIPEKEDVERDALAEAFAAAGGEILHIGKFWEKPDLNGLQPIIYGPDTFALVLAQVLEMNLLSVEDKWLAELEFEWLKRRVEVRELGEIAGLERPLFAKPVQPKLFRAGVHATTETLAELTADLPSETLLLISEAIQIRGEARAFVHQGETCDLSVYEGEMEPAAAYQYLHRFCAAKGPELPLSLVIDLGFHPDRGFFLLEFNSAWGAGLNGCDPAKVLPAIIAASQPDH